MRNLCDTGQPFPYLFSSTSALLNVALFVPVAVLGVLIFRRPITVVAVLMLFSSAVELIQATTPLGRSCSVTDVVANISGTLIGVCAGAVWLRLRKEHIKWLTKDVLWGAAVAAVGIASVVSLLRYEVRPVDAAATQDRAEAHTRSVDGAYEWISQAAEDIFGEGTKVEDITEGKGGNRIRITANTDRGEVIGWWPDKTLERAWTSNPKGDKGTLSEAEVGAVGRNFAARLFRSDVTGSRETIRATGNGETQVHVITYRRYAHGVMMPMRLDITVTSAGRIMGFTARSIPDPVLEKPVMDRNKAQTLAHEDSGKRPNGASLLAQKVNGAWRPVWMVSVGSEDNEEVVYVDGVSGNRVSVDPEPVASPK
jgi:hypothetical protein